MSDTDYKSVGYLIKVVGFGDKAENLSSRILVFLKNNYNNGKDSGVQIVRDDVICAENHEEAPYLSVCCTDEGAALAMMDVLALEFKVFTQAEPALLGVNDPAARPEG